MVFKGWSAKLVSNRSVRFSKDWIGKDFKGLAWAALSKEWIGFGFKGLDRVAVSQEWTGKFYYQRTKVWFSQFRNRRWYLWDLRVCQKKRKLTDIGLCGFIDIGKQFQGR